MGKDEGEKYTASPEETAEGQGGAQGVPSGPGAEEVDRSDVGTPDAATPEIAMEDGEDNRSAS